MNLIKLLSQDNYFILNKALIKKIGLESSMLLSVLCSYQNMYENKEFFKDYEKILEDSCLTMYSYRRSMNYLQEIGLLTITKRGIPSRNYYYINEEKLIEILEEKDDKKFLQSRMCEIEQSRTFETEQSNNNNKEINSKESKKENIINNNIKEKRFFENDDLNKLFNDFLEMRKKIKKPATETAIKLLLDKLNKQENDDIRKKMLEKSIVNCWQGLFELSRDEKDKLEKEKWENLTEEEEQAELDNFMKEIEDL